MTKNQKKIRVGLVVPHIFLHQDILDEVIFSPGHLALSLAENLSQHCDVTLYSPGPAKTSVKNVTADLSYFENELALRGDTYTDLLRKHPFTFVTLARQVQAELIAKAFDAANQNEIDIIHIYTNEEDIALPFSKLCQKPVVFTHHDPFNFSVKYKNVFPKYKEMNWISLSYAQRSTMPEDTNWAANIYHGIDKNTFSTSSTRKRQYIAYLGRIIEPKGVHLAIQAVQKFNKKYPDERVTLKIAGKHYSDQSNDSYWHSEIEPLLGNDIEYVGFIKENSDKQKFLQSAKALIIPSLFDEPFGMVMIEALACGTPLIGLDSGAIPEVIQDSKNGYLVRKDKNTHTTVNNLAQAIRKVGDISSDLCRADFEERFTSSRMAMEHRDTYQKLILKNN